MSLGSLFSNTVKESLTGDTVKSWNHATRLFVDNNYALNPKNDFLYHVFFDINPEAVGAAFQDNDRLKEVGMLVKAVQLPKYTIETTKRNAYNRPNIVQNKINYNEVTINFYDDNSDRVVSFWADYLQYYFRDADGATSDNISPYVNPHKYYPKTLKWGYDIKDGKLKRYLNAVRIYSLHQKRFTEYVLVNPIIKQFNHGDHRNDGTGVLECEMRLEFETVLYNFGSISVNNENGAVKGFADLHYDKTPSPLAQAGGSRSVMGPGGLIESGTGIFQDLSSGNLLGATVKAAKTFNTFKDANLKQIASTEFSEFAKDVLRNNNPQSKISIPFPSNIATGIGVIAEAGNLLQQSATRSNGIPRNPATNIQQTVVPTNPPLNTNFGNNKVKSNGESLVPTRETSQNLPLTGGQQTTTNPIAQTINNRNRQ